MTYAAPVTRDGRIDERWGRAPRLAVATVEQGVIASWEVHEVGWDVAHDEGTEGAHHARVVRFLREHEVTCVVAQHMGQGMARTLGAMGVRVVPAAVGVDARAAVVSAAG